MCKEGHGKHIITNCILITIIFVCVFVLLTFSYILSYL